MSRRKTKKLAPKRNTNNAFTAIIKLEKDFLQTPKKLVGQLNKETMFLKQKDHKIKKAINKVNNQLKNIEKKIQVIATKENKPATKKQLHNAKKLFNTALNEQDTLSQQSDALKKSLDTIRETQARLVAMSKHLSQFQKDWFARDAKKVFNDRKPKKISSVTKNTTIVENLLEEGPTSPKPNDVRLDEPSEMVS